MEMELGAERLVFLLDFEPTQSASGAARRGGVESERKWVNMCEM